MYPTESSFYITLTSNSSLNYYPDNTLSHFTHKLPFVLDLKNDQYNWNVGIVKYVCTSIKIEEKLPYEKLYIMLTALPSEGSLGADITEILNEYPEFYNLIIKDNLLNRYTEKLTLNASVFSKDIIQVYVKGQIVKLKRNYNYTVDILLDTIFAQIPKNLWSVTVNYIKNQKTKTKEIKTAKFENNVKIIRKLIPGEYNPNYMCIYSDIIKPQVVGNIMARCMIMQPVKFNSSENYQIYEASHIQYYPVEKQRITDINILFCNELGEPIKFENDTFCTMILLHFQKGI